MLELLKGEAATSEESACGDPVGDSNCVNYSATKTRRDPRVSERRSGDSRSAIWEATRHARSTGRNLLLHISRDDGVMVGFFDADEIEVVRRWIVSLSKPPVAPDRSDRSGRCEICSTKKIPAQVMRGHTEALLAENRSATYFALKTTTRFCRFLRGRAPAVVDPFTGKPLIKAGAPQESAFYLHITDPSGAMSGPVPPDRACIVQRWIESLGSQSVAIKPFRASKVDRRDLIRRFSSLLRRAMQNGYSSLSKAGPSRFSN
ncbi:MAG: hypothetical protein R3C05_28285 [Pirellulaceae bacterium]